MRLPPRSIRSRVPALVAGALLFCTTFAAGQEMRVRNGATVLWSGSSFNFGATAAGRPLGREFVIHNDGDAPLRLGEVTVPAGFAVLRRPPAEIPAGGSGAFSVELRAAALGEASGLLLLPHNAIDASSPYELTISGTVLAGRARLRVQNGGDVLSSGGRFDFGTTDLDRPLGREFVIYNDGAAALELGPISVPRGFALLARPRSRVPPGGSTAFSVELVADMAGSHAGRLAFDHGGADAPSPFELTVSGTVRSFDRAEIRVQNGDLVIENGGRFDFGRTPSGRPLGRQFRVWNDGDAPLSLGRVTVPAGFALVEEPPAEIPPRGIGSFSVRLEAAAAGRPAGEVSFRHGGGNTVSPFVIVVRGEVSAGGPVAGRPQIRLQNGGTVLPNGGRFDFGSTTVGRPLGRQFLLYNDGDAALHVRRLVAPPGFRITTEAPAAIPARGSGAFSVERLADKPGLASGLLSFEHDGVDTTTPFELQVVGTVH